MMDALLIEEAKARLAERYTTMELVELIEVPVEDIIDVYWDQILNHSGIMEDIGFGNED